ncbi:KEOPS complex subunit Pcc1 [Candidatus Nitrososphaera sp. FF02]|uniref:KEOPS complex subunit Pcc1 n=1 Tax=Candidatus Nitrososphaera sp. FF02 TaxID=3398226 RepID=UPI0039ED063C
MTRKSCRSEITIKVKGPKARSIYSALAPDLEKLQGRDESIGLDCSGSDVTFSMETDDIASLRANVNSYLRLVDASYRCLTV